MIVFWIGQTQSICVWTRVEVYNTAAPTLYRHEFLIGSLVLEIRSHCDRMTIIDATNIA